VLRKPERRARQFEHLALAQVQFRHVRERARDLVGAGDDGAGDAIGRQAAQLPAFEQDRAAGERQLPR